MAITNPNRIITVSMLSDFLAKLKNNVLNAYYTKTEANDTFAQKAGNIDQDFSVKTLKFGGVWPAGSSYANVTLSCDSSGANLLLSSNQGHSLVIPLSGQELIPGSNGFDISKQVCIFQMPSGSEAVYTAYAPATNVIQCSGIENDENTILFISANVAEDPEDSTKKNKEGFYLFYTDGSNGQKLKYLCAPTKYSIYYGNPDGDNPTTNYFCKWSGSAFSIISTGSGGSIDGEYTIAEESDITEIINTPAT